ncbi:MAG: NAD-glutamate dehydrogenase [Alphaproteobacteria bacterium]|nr:NAD-glutamate dehydrogenase [Alphaproteobacteria bacterium]
MTSKYSRSHRTLVDKILSHLPKKPAKAKGGDAAMFVEQYFARVPLVDFESIDTEVSCTQALSSLEFFRARPRKGPKIRVFTPDKKTHGWQSTHTVVEVLCDDMPFLVDSVSAELNRQGFTVYSSIHPVMHVARDSDGKLDTIYDAGKAPESSTTESLQYYEISPLPDDVTPEKLAADIARILEGVRLSVRDWRQIVNKGHETIDALHEIPSSFRIDELAEVIAFLEWLVDNNFVFLGYVEYSFKNTKSLDVLEVVPGSELGIFKLEDFENRPQGLEGIPQEVRHFARIPQLLEITKSTRKSIVHRPVHMDYIGIKRYNKAGEVIGERRFLGLFTSTVYYQSADAIPIIRRKVQLTMERAGFGRSSHDGKALKTILEFYPRDELFQTSPDELFEISMGILALEGRPGVRLFARKDVFERFVSCMVFVPRERFSTEQRFKIQDIVEHFYHGTVTAYYTQVTDMPMSRLHLIVKTTPGKIPQVDMEALQAKLIEVVNLWVDGLRAALVEKYGAGDGEKLFHDYRDAFPSDYTNRYSVGTARYDVEKIEEAIASGTLALDLFGVKDLATTGQFHLKVYNPKEQVALSDILPTLENMGLKVIEEIPSFVIPKDYPQGVWIRDFRLTSARGGMPDIRKQKALFEEALAKVWTREVENDSFNRLVLLVGLGWRDIVMLRAYAKYLKQAGFTYSQEAIAEALLAHPGLTRLLVQLFHARFGLGKKKAGEEESLHAKILEGLASVSSGDEDKIIRRYATLIEATLRTNYFQPDAAGNNKPYVSFKLDSAKVPDLPLPRPYAEIFVYSRRVEGIHLRGAKVARGGLRWSDRREDFRTEVLGLVKAQMVKNVVIVPEGSKGGFVLKDAPADRDGFMAEGIECYKTFLRGLLDLTDNIVSGKVVPPKNVVRHDENDPYLVVAADKGTATFSDIANSVSAEYGFWLGDAFASGGSVGYDHKKMGITARGGWISVMRHFREMGRDCQKEPFTCTGIGGMAGDVFGNGLLMSKQTKLVAAFNHIEIFLDPAPDPAESFKERQRLFNNPKLNWVDYNPKLISKGGGVFKRNSKSIELSKEVRAVLGIESTSLSGEELIKAILRAPVDMLWNGGIGTYVKESDESHAEVGDKTNDAVRVNGNELRCKVVGEGGNLGFTQRGRVEYALGGGRINTDAIDNSAGVDCSDHEVNIKIALARAMENGSLSLKKRDEFLATMTNEVAALCLRDNTLQTQALTIDQIQGMALTEAQSRLMRRLEKDGVLNRAVEFLPDDEAIAQRLAGKKGLTRPELAVLLGYSKLVLYRQLLASKMPDDAHYESDLLRYFPAAMQEKFRKEILSHALRREIITTMTTNSIINRMGSTFFNQVSEDTGVEACDIARAYTITRDAFCLRALWNDLEAAESTLPVETVVWLQTQINTFVYRMVLWFLRNLPQPLNIKDAIAQFAGGITDIQKSLESMLAPHSRDIYEKALAACAEKGVPEKIGKVVASLDALSSACDIVLVAARAKKPVKLVGKVYFEIGTRLHLGWLRTHARRLTAESYWPRLAATAVVSDLLNQQRRLTSEVIATLGKDEGGNAHVSRWIAGNEREIARYDQFIDDLRANEPLDFSMLVVALRKVQAICSV